MAAPHRRRSRWLWLELLVPLLIAAVLGALVWADRSGVLLARLVDRAVLASGGQLQLEGVEGSVFGTVRAARLGWREAVAPGASRPTGLELGASDVRLKASVMALLQGRIELDEVRAARLELLSDASDAPPTLPASLRLPLGVALNELQIDELVLRTRGQADAVVLRELQASLRHAARQWTIDSFAVRGDFGAVRASGRLADAPPYALSGRIVLETRVQDEALAIDGLLGGTLAAPDLDLRTVLREAGVSGKVRLAPFSRDPVAALDLSIVALNLARFGAGLPVTDLSGTLTARPDARRSPNGVPAPSGSLGLPALRGQLALVNAVPGRIETSRLPFRSLDARVMLSGDSLRLRELSVAGAPGRLTGEVSFDLAPVAGRPAWELRLATDRLDAQQIHAAAQPTELRGTVHLIPEGAALAAEVDLADARRAVALSSRARLQDGVLTIASARLDARGGQADVSGTLQTVVPYRHELAGKVSRLDPSQFMDSPTGLLNGEFSLKGQLKPHPDSSVQLLLTDSRWAGQVLAGRLSGHVGPGERVSALDADLRWGGSHLKARGALGAVGDRLRLDLDVARLQELDARLGGRLSLRSEWRDSLRSPGVTLSLTGQDLRGRAGPEGPPGVRVDTLRVQADTDALDALLGLLAQAGLPGLPGWAGVSGGMAGVAGVGPSGAPLATPPAGADRGVASRVAPVRPLSASVQAEGLVTASGQRLDRLTLELGGDTARQSLLAQLSSRAQDLDVRVRLEGGFEAGGSLRWRGRLLEATQTGASRVRLQSPATVQLGSQQALLEGGVFAIDGDQGARLELDQLGLASGRIVARGAMAGMPLRWLEPWLIDRGVRTRDAEALRLGARFDLAAGLSPASAPVGVVQLSRESGDLVLEVPGAGGAVERMSAGLSDLALRLDLTGERVDATLRVRGAALGTATGQASMPWRAVPGASALRADLSVPLSGRLEVSVPSLAFTRSLVGEAWRLGGALEARLDLGGTPSAPRVSGSLAGSGLLAEQRELGMRLTDGELKAQIVDNMVDVQTLRFASGKGSVRMSGSLRPDERSEAVLTLERMPIPLGAGQRLVVSGESRAVFSRGVLSLRGALRADEGVIEITGNSTPRVSSDVVVVRNAGEAAARRTEALQRATARDEAARAARTAAGAPPEGEAAGDGSRGFRILSDLQIDLGDRLRVFGAGLEARLAGQLTLRGRLPDAPRLDGTVRIVQGMYTGFGQKLEIERGTLVFSGAVDNPAIDVVAYRRYLPVEAGVAITGTAQVPKLTLVSKPDVPEQDKLSWLVLGVPADSAGSQGAALGAAAALIASSDPRAPSFNVASTVGLDVLSIRSGQTGGLGSSSAASLAQDSIVTLGKRLTDRLFVSYEQSLRGLQNLFRLQYEITERFSIRARVGTSNAIDLLWTKRYD